LGLTAAPRRFHGEASGPSSVRWVGHGSPPRSCRFACSEHPTRRTDVRLRDRRVGRGLRVERHARAGGDGVHRRTAERHPIDRRATPSTPAASASPTLSSPTGSASADPLALVRRPIGQLGTRLLATVQVDGEPEWIGAGAGAIWVTNRGLDRVQRVDPATNAVDAFAPVGEPCNGFAIAFGAVWTASCADQSLLRIDPVTVRVTGRVATTIAADGEGQVAAGFGSVWISGGDGRLRRFDPKRNDFIATIAIPNGADAVVAGASAIWVSDPAGNEVLRIDPATNAIAARVPVGPHPQFLAASSTGVWALNQDDGTVARIGPADNAARITAADSPGRDVGCITTGLNDAWSTVPDLPLTRIDSDSNAVTEQWSGPGGDCLTTGFGSVWLVNNALGTVSRIAPPG
jgi:hypothetical protein